MVIFVALLLAATACSQGTVNFRNTGPFITEADRFVRDVNGELVVGGSFLAQLYYGPPGSLEPQLIPVASSPATFRDAPTSELGTWIGGVRTLQGFATPGAGSTAASPSLAQ